MEWDVGPVIVSFGPFSLRWYSLLFTISLVFGLIISRWFFKIEKKDPELGYELFFYMFIALLLGARLGHCLFYNPGYYLSNPVEILKVWEGGLASHGAAIAIPIALLFYARKHRDQSFVWILDRTVIAVALVACFVRLGNFFNSEIYGKVTEVPWAVSFVRVDGLPRHPTQLYEAAAYFGLFVVLILIYNTYRSKIKPYLLSCVFALGMFVFRFSVEFLKANQSPFEKNMIINMGQILSIPFILLGLFFLYKLVTAKSEKQPK